MSAITGFIAGLIAGFIMGVSSEVGYRVNIFKSSLAYVDGTFVANLTRHPLGKAQLHVIGAIMHLVTSAIFGGIFGIIVFFLGIERNLHLLFVLYVFLLWVSMLVTALPIAGQGFMGKKLGRFTWLEQLVLHIIYGIVFAWLVL